MKHIQTFPGKLLVLVGAMGLCAAFAAPPKPATPPAPAAATPSATAVYQRQSDTESIELSNLPEEGSVRLPISVDLTNKSTPSANEARSAVAETASAVQPKVKKKVLKKIKNADGIEEEVWVDSEEDADSTTDTAAADSKNGQGGTMASGGGSAGANSWNSGSAVNTGGGYSGGGYSGGGYAGGTTGGTAASSGSTASNGSTSGTGSTGSTGGASPVVSGTPVPTTTIGSTVVPVAPTPTTPLQAKLDSYRSMMLSEVATGQVTNPAITRRYQMINRATYQGMYGY